MAGDPEPGPVQARPPRVELVVRGGGVGSGDEVVGGGDRRVDVVATRVGDEHQIARLREHLRCPEHPALDRAREARVARDDDPRERTRLARGRAQQDPVRDSPGAVGPVDQQGLASHAAPPEHRLPERVAAVECAAPGDIRGVRCLLGRVGVEVHVAFDRAVDVVLVASVPLRRAGVGIPGVGEAVGRRLLRPRGHHGERRRRDHDRRQCADGPPSV